MGITLFDTSGGACDVDGEQAGPVEVEEGGEGVTQEGVDTGDEGPRDVDVAEPLAHDAPGLDSTRALSLVRRGRDLVKVPMRSLLSSSTTRWLTYSDPLSACKASTVKGRAVMRASRRGRR